MKVFRSDYKKRFRVSVSPWAGWMCVVGAIVAGVVYCEHDKAWLRAVTRWVFARSASRMFPADGDRAAVADRGGQTRSVALSDDAVGIAGSGGGALGPDHEPNMDADAALFAALERLERRVAAATARARQSVVALEYTAADAAPGTRRIASGVVISDRGDVLSVRIDPPSRRVGSHDVAAAESPPIIARDFSGHRHAVEWVAGDPHTGLTLLRIAPRAVRPVRLAVDEPNLGSQVFIVGNPFGMGHSVSRGHIAGLDRTLEFSTRELGGLLQIQAPLCPGDSGAAVVNIRGEWLGLIRSGLAIPASGSARGTEAESFTAVPSVGLPEEPSSSSVISDHLNGRVASDNDFGFAISARDGLWVAEQLRTKGNVDRAYLGVRLEPGAAGRWSQHSPLATVESRSANARTEPSTGAVDSARVHLAAENGSTGPAAGAVLDEVLSGTPAAEAGLRSGDIIVALDGKQIRSTYELTDRLDHIQAGETVALRVWRRHGSRPEQISVSVRTASRPDPSRLAELAAAPGPPDQKRSTHLRPVLLTTTAAPALPPSPLISHAPVSANPVIPPSPVPRATSGIPPALESQPQSQASAPATDHRDSRTTVPHAVEERIERLERRLEQLESSTAHGRLPRPDPGR